MKKLLLVVIVLLFAVPAFGEDVQVRREDGSIDTYKVFQHGREVEVFRIDKGGRYHKTTVYRDRQSPNYRRNQPAETYVPFAEPND